MTDGQFRAQASLSPRAGPPVLPPLSKFYCGPAAGWSSAEGSPSHNGSTWSLSNPRSETPTTNPPRASPSFPSHPSSQWPTQESQGWHSGPPTSIPATKQLTNSYALTTGPRQSPVNPGWDSRPTSTSMDTSTWGVNHSRSHGQNTDGTLRPPLPPRPEQSPEDDNGERDQMLKRYSPHSKYSSQHPSARGSATTIDVPLFLQPQPFDPETAPPLPGRPSPPLQHSRNNSSHSASQSQQLPPHPPKIPLNVDESEFREHTANQRPVQRPRFDPQKSFETGHSKQSSQGSLSSTSSRKRPRFDPRSSHDAEGSQGVRQTLARRPSIPIQHATGLDARKPSSASMYHSGSHQPPSAHQSVTARLQNSYDEENRYQLAQRLHKESISPVQEGDRWASSPYPNRWDSKTSYVPSPEPQHALLPQQDGRSTSATEASSNMPTASTPESHQTSNTSLKENEAQGEGAIFEEESNESFYWHSGRSSDSGYEQSPETTIATQQNVGQRTLVDKATSQAVKETMDRNSYRSKVEEPSKIGEQLRSTSPSKNEQSHSQPDQRVRGLPARSSSLSPHPQVEYTSSALGFGGPSDWEYFGDYEAEEIDDEELYAHKPRAELPANSSLDETIKSSGPYRLPDVDSGQEGDLVLPKLDSGPQLEVSSSHTQRFESVEEDQDLDEDGVLESKWSPSTTPTTPHANSSRPITVTSEPLPSEGQRPDLEEIIRAWSDSPHVGKSSDTEPSKQALLKQRETQHMPGEASLASTPGENVLGVHSIPKDAPPIPKLPDSIDFEQHNADSKVSDVGLQEYGQTQQANEAQLSVLSTNKSLSHPANSRSDFGRTENNGIRARAYDMSSHNDMSIESDAADASLEDTANIAGVRTETSNTREALSLSDAVTQSEPKSGVSQPAKSLPRDDAFNKSVTGLAIPPTESHDTRPGTTQTRLQAQDAAQPTQALAEEEHKPPILADSSHGVVGRTSSPASDFARKRQMFESPTEKVSSSSPLVRKPSEKAKQTTSDSSTAEDKKSSGNRTPDRFAGSLGHSPATDVASSLSLRTTPAFSQRPSDDDFGRKSTEQTELTVQSFNQIPSERPSKEQASNEELSSNTQANPPSHSRSKFEEVVGSPQNEGRMRESLAEREVQPFVPPLAGGIVQQQSAAEPAVPAPSASGTETSSANPATDKQFVTTAEEDPNLLKVTMEEKSCQADMVDDPYADLDPWGRASLNRFAAMLREEGRAESNRDKLNIFNVFASRESRLRVVLYGSDEDLILATKSPEKGTDEPLKVPSSKLQHLAKASSNKKMIQRTNSTKVQPVTKELPPLPPNRDSVVGPPTSKLTSLTVDTHQGSKFAQVATGDSNIHKDQQVSKTTLESGDSPQYSPGGRPVVQQVAQRSSSNLDLSLQTSVFVESLETHNSSKNDDPSSCAPMPNDNHTITKEQSPAYSRPRFNEDGSEVKNYLTNRRSIYRPFATQTMESMDHALNFGREPEFTIPPTPLPQNSVVASMQVAQEATKGSDKSSLTGPSPGPSPDLRRFVEADFDPLVMVLPASESANDDSPRLAEFRRALDAVPDDFSFIHASVVAWDAAIKKQREENERQRHARQIESEQRIDALFDDHEIGYGDIAELEGEFKQSEAAKKAEEDRSEYELFVENVFNVVWTRLHFEVDQLKPHYEQFSKLMDETLAGRDMFEIPQQGLALAPTMTAFLGLHQKLEIRHQKAFEAVLERDRRLKKTEISPWYSLSNLAKVKQLEKQFEDAEKKAIIGYCQERNERANKLMDVLDQNTLRGVGANQDYMEAVMKAVRRIASGRAYASVPGLDAPTRGIDLVEKAKTITTRVASSSEQIVQTFHVADMLLNSADYEVSVAKAKVARADIATLTKLKEERTKEDQKLMRDLEHRLALIREDSRKTNDEIVKLMLFLGVQNGKALNAQLAPHALGMQQQQQVTAGAQAREHQPNALEKAREGNLEHKGEV